MKPYFQERIIISELEFLMLSVPLTKIGITSPAILDTNDLQNIINEHSTNMTITDLIEVVQIKVLLNISHYIR